MKMLKHVLCFALVLLLTVSLCACGRSSAPEEVPTENPVELAKSKLEEAYTNYCESSFADLGYDRMSLTIDTNPNDLSYSSAEDDAIAAIQRLNLYFGLPSSLLEKMANTRALDGTQSQNCGKYTVTWNYHPDKGLKVIYEVNP